MDLNPYDNERHDTTRHDNNQDNTYELDECHISLTRVMNLVFTTKNNVNINSTPKYKTMQLSIMSLLTRILQ
jgi:hypothetical protein